MYDKLLWSDVFACCRHTGYLFLLAMRPHVIERSVLFDNRLIDLHLGVPVPLRADNRRWLKAMALLDRRVAHVANANTGYPADMPSWLAAGINAARAVRKAIPLLNRIGRPEGRILAAAHGLSPISWTRFEWLIRNNEKLRRLITDTLDDPDALPSRIFDRKQVMQVLGEHLAGKGRQRDILFALLTFGRWHKRYAAAHG